MMQKTKIIHFIGALTKGGAERFVVDLCNELATDEQYDIHLVSISENDPVESFVNDIHPDVTYFSFEKGKGFSLSIFLKLSTWLENEEPDIVHSHLNSFEYLSLYFLRNHSSSCFHTIHSTAQLECPVYLIKTFRKICYKFGKVTPVTVSLDGRRTFRDYYRLNNDILIVNGRQDPAPNKAYDQLLNQYKLNSDKFLLVHTGRIISVKNQQLLIKAIKQFNTLEEKKCRLLLLGEVKDEVLYQQLLGMAESDPNIIFLGGQHNVIDYLRIADAFCLSSTHEGMPISLIEALSVGCIPVCTPAGGIGQMISHRNTGFLSKDFSISSYYTALKEALYYENKAIIKLNAIINFKSNYHISIAARNHAETYFNAFNMD